jgi:uncharacterized protein YjbJ (UPF0337 family)
MTQSKRLSDTIAGAAKEIAAEVTGDGKLAQEGANQRRNAKKKAKDQSPDLSNGLKNLT